MSKPTANAMTTVITASLARRHRAERRFRRFAQSAVGFALIMLAVLLVSILGKGISGFTRHEIRLEIPTAAIADALRHDPATINYYALTATATQATVSDTPAGDDPIIRRQLLSLLGTFAAFDVKRQLLAHPDHTGETIAVWVPLSDHADQLLKGRINRHASELERPVNDRQLGWIDRWEDDGRIRRNINRDFFTRGDSRAPEAAGFLGAIVGSLITLAVCLVVAVPVAIMAAITLEEFTRKSRTADMLEVVINNLAAVPSIIYGLLGLSVFLQLFGMPRSSSLVGGLTLAMLIMPVMIIASRAAIRAVPPSMRQAAVALGATPLQVVRHHVLPYALPGILTGTILSICRALGETAPLLLIGMVAFVADIPRGVTDPTTVMPVEIYLWASSPELGFIEKTSSAIMVLMLILLLLNLAAITLRNKSQLSWN